MLSLMRVEVLLIRLELCNLSLVLMRSFISSLPATGLFYMTYFWSIYWYKIFRENFGAEKISKASCPRKKGNHCMHRKFASIELFKEPMVKKTQLSLVLLLNFGRKRNCTGLQNGRRRFFFLHVTLIPRTMKNPKHFVLEKVEPLRHQRAQTLCESYSTSHSLSHHFSPSLSPCLSHTPSHSLSPFLSISISMSLKFVSHHYYAILK